MNLEKANERFPFGRDTVDLEIKHLDPAGRGSAINPIFPAQYTLLFPLKPDVADRVIRPESEADLVAARLEPHPHADDRRIVRRHRRRCRRGRYFWRCGCRWR